MKKLLELEYIPFSRPYISQDEIEAVIDTLKTGWITVGPQTKKFETRFSQYIGSKHALAVNSCTSGLHLALIAAGVQSGDEVITTTYTFAATAEVIFHVGAKPVLVDIEEDTQNIDPEKIKAAITNKTKAIIPVHFAGHPCAMDEIMKIAQENNLKVIEDAAHALGAKYNGKNIGNIGDFTTFSFYATKNLTTGEGGMITTNNDEDAEMIKSLTLHGISKDAWKRYSSEGSWFYEINNLGYKYNMTDIQAALGLGQLEKFDWNQKQREHIVARYNEGFADIDEIIRPVTKPDITNANHLYIIRLKLESLNIGRNDFINELKEKQIGTSVHFIPLHIHPFYQKKYGNFPIAEYIYERVISLPLYPTLNFGSVDRIIGAVKDIIYANKKTLQFKISKTA